MSLRAGASSSRALMGGRKSFNRRGLDSTKMALVPMAQVMPVMPRSACAVVAA